MNIILGVRNAEFGGGGADALLSFEGGVVVSVKYKNYESANYLWSQVPGWAQATIGMTLEEVEKWRAGFFEGEEDDHRATVVSFTPRMVFDFAWEEYREPQIGSVPRRRRRV